MGSRELCWTLLGSPGLSRALLVSTGLVWALLGSPGSSGLSWAFLCSSVLFRALLVSLGLVWALLGSLGLGWARLDSSRVHLVILSLGLIKFAILFVSSNSRSDNYTPSTALHECEVSFTA